MKMEHAANTSAASRLHLRRPHLQLTLGFWRQLTFPTRSVRGNYVGQRICTFWTLHRRKEPLTVLETTSPTPAGSLTFDTLAICDRLSSKGA